MERLPESLGMPIATPAELQPSLSEFTEELETPALLAYFDAMETNVRGYVSFAEDHDVQLRSQLTSSLP